MTDVTERNVIAPEQSKQHDDVHAGQYGEAPSLPVTGSEMMS